MNLQSILDDVVATLRAMPTIAIDHAAVLPAVPRDQLAAITENAGVRLPPWVVQLYGEIGGAHISWRLEESGYQMLSPDRKDNSYRYDISGNLDLLSPEEACRSLTGHPWHQLYDEPVTADIPIDLASFALTARCSVTPAHEHLGLVLHSLYDDRIIPLDVTPIEYLQRGAERLFMSDWQRTLTSIADYANVGPELDRIKSQLLAQRGGARH